MKKVILSLGIILLMSGCGENMTTMKCENTSTTNGLTSSIEYKIDYDDNDDNVKYVTITYKYNQNANTTEDQTDGVGTGTDGTTEDNDVNEKDGIVDGVVGDAIDEGVDAVTDTILDIAGLRSAFENQMSTYDNIEGFSYDVERNTDNEYTVVYKIDFDKIADNDLVTFNLDRDLSTLQTTYENQGYTCK